ncbi:hypothetical protein [Kribbella sp. NPDC004875]
MIRQCGACDVQASYAACACAFVIALIDELEKPAHHRKRFTLEY